MKNRFAGDAKNIFVLAIMIIGIFFCYIAIVEYGELSYKVKTFPLWTSITLITLCVIELLIGYIKTKRENNTGEAKEIAAKRKRDGLGIFFGFCWMLALAIGILVTGFYFALPVFTIVFLRVNKIGWIFSVIFSGIVLAIAYFGFGMALNLHLFPGILFG